MAFSLSITTLKLEHLYAYKKKFVYISAIVIFLVESTVHEIGYWSWSSLQQNKEVRTEIKQRKNNRFLEQYIQVHCTGTCSDHHWQVLISLVLSDDIARMKYRFNAASKIAKYIEKDIIIQIPFFQKT